MAATREEVLNKIIDVVAEKLNADRNNITPTSSFTELGADSLDIVELVMILEELFNIEISDEDAEEIVTIQDAAERVSKLLS